VSRPLVVARATAVELLRRRTVVVLMVAVPLAFYIGRHELTGQSIRFLAVGMAWALSTLAAFAGIAGQAFDPRLRLSGYSSGELLAGRVLGLAALAGPLVAGYALVVVLDRDLERGPGVLLAMGLTAAVALPFGLLVAAVVRRPLEAAMLLLVVSGLQMILDPANDATRVLPFWSVREVLTWTVDGTGGDYLQRGLVHAAITVVALSVATVILRTSALRRRRHLERVPRRV
jgi:hypothetical protein